MTALFVKVDLEDALWVLDNIRYTERPPDARCTLELTAAMMDGRLQRYTQRAWAARWHCSRGKVRSIAAKVAATCWPGHQWTTQGPPKDQWGTTLGLSFQHLTSQSVTTQGPPKDHPRTYTCALPLKKERPKKEEEQQSAKPLTAKQQEALQGLDCLRTLRTELHQKAMGKATRGKWVAGKASEKATLAKIARFLGEVREADIHPKPLAALEALARWAYLAPGAAWLRNGSDPLGHALGGKANDPSKRMERAVAALDWVDGGQAARSPQKPAKGNAGGLSFRERLTQQQPNERVYVNAPEMT